MAILVKNIGKILVCFVNEQITSFFHENDHNSAQKSPNPKILVPKVMY